MLTRKIDDQAKLSTSQPPRIGPTTMPMPETRDQTAIAFGRSSSGNTLAMIDRVAGIVSGGADAHEGPGPDQLVGGCDERRQDAADAEDREAGEERESSPEPVGQGARDESSPAKTRM